MRVLWICNTILPIIARHLKVPAGNKEGWLTGLCDSILKKSAGREIELHVSFPVDKEMDGCVGKTEGGLYYHGFYENIANAEVYDKTLENRIAKILDDVKPDVIHCFGTEFAHTLAVARVCMEPWKIIVGIQGICSSIADAYMADMPEKVQKSITFRDFLKRDSIKRQQQKYVERGRREREILSAVGNVIGRTDFDREYALSINPGANYFKLNETLRPCFYEGRWSEALAKAHTIFVSQADYPLKGFHYLLSAADKLNQKYGDVEIRVAGNSLVNYSSLKDKIKISAYGKYLRNLISSNGLEERVHFLGKLTDIQMKEELLGCGLFVCCSSNENSPNSLGEAMLLGVPCVASDVGGITSIFDAGVDGIVYKGFRKGGSTLEGGADELRRAVENMWDNPKERDKYCENAVKHAKRTHDSVKNYKALLNIYEQVLARGKDKKDRITIAFVSNYINHHQIPFCENMCGLCEKRGGSFYFIQTEKMENERVRMGWEDRRDLDFVHRFYEEEEYCRRLIKDSDVVLFGGCDDEAYIEERLHDRKLVIRISERLYKTGQWKAVSPRGLMKKYHDHTRYRKEQVYLLCAGAYVASDFGIVKAYPQKMFKWGYFPAAKHYDVDKLMESKNDGKNITKILWAGRFIDWKHPELSLETAAYLKNKGIPFCMDIIGGGEMEDWLKDLAKELAIEDKVCFRGFKKPEEVRGYMEKADIFLFTSDRQEGWGAVANEAMNSGCAVVANHMIGSVPYLIKNGVNGMVYRDGNKNELFALTEKLVNDAGLRQKLGVNAHDTITKVWNPENAANNLMKLIDMLVEYKKTDDARRLPQNRCVVDSEYSPYPCEPEHPIPEKEMYKKIL